MYFKTLQLTPIHSARSCTTHTSHLYIYLLCEYKYLSYVRLYISGEAGPTEYSLFYRALLQKRPIIGIPHTYTYISYVRVSSACLSKRLSLEHISFKDQAH